MGAASRMIGTLTDVGRGAAAAGQAFGIAGALISTGIAFRGWSSRKGGQTAVRKKISELLMRVLRIQHLLAMIDRLECPICASHITLDSQVRHCVGHAHCFHASCLS